MNLIEDYIEQFVKLDPPCELCFDPDNLDPIENIIITYLHIHNSAPTTADNNIAFKIKLTHPKLFFVKWPYGVVEKNSFKTI